MALYFPVLADKEAATTLQHDVGALLIAETDPALDERVNQLEEQLGQYGAIATFGAEVEFQFCVDPERTQKAAEAGIADNDDIEKLREPLYYQVLQAAWPRGYTGHLHQYSKGEVINGLSGPPVMDVLHGRDSDHQEGIFEVRSAPATGLKAIDRYWNLIKAIGQVADRQGLLATICSTHLNAALLCEGEAFYSLKGFSYPESRPLLAAVQRNLNAVYPLQIDAGLEAGWVVNEAFPRHKLSSTAVHDYRLELRHPTVGVVDPRLDIVAALSGLVDAASGQVSERTLQETIVCRAISHVEASGPGFNLKTALENAVIDSNTGKVIMPSHPGFAAAYGDLYLSSLDQLTRILSKGKQETVSEDDGMFLRTQFENIRIRKGRAIVLPQANLPVLWALLKHVELVEGRAALRVKPQVRYDSPEGHDERRQFIRQSPLVRRILGGALSRLTPADEAIEARRAIVNNQMVVV